MAHRLYLRGSPFLYQIPYGVTGYKNVTHIHTEHQPISFPHTLHYHGLQKCNPHTHRALTHKFPNSHHITGYKNVTHIHTEHPHISFRTHTTLAGYKNVTRKHIELQPTSFPHTQSITGYKNVTRIQNKDYLLWLVIQMNHLKASITKHNQQS